MKFPRRWLMVILLQLLTWQLLGTSAQASTTSSEASRYRYDPYGKLLGQSGAYAAANSVRYSTKLWDVESGLSYYGYRYYAPNAGRWLSRDPLTEGGGINRYAMVLNNPVALIDPDGQIPLLVPLLKGAGAGGVSVLGQMIFAMAFNDEVHTLEQAFDQVDWGEVAGETALGMIPWRTPGGKYGEAALGQLPGLIKDLLSEKCLEQTLLDYAVNVLTGLVADKGMAALGKNIDLDQALQKIKNKLGLGGPKTPVPEIPAAAKTPPTFSGTAKPWTKGATPNSTYTHIDPKTGKAVQNAIYDGAGDVVGHVDFKNHGPGAPSGHGHTFPQPGNPASGHGAGKPHIPNNQLPPGWDTLPSGVQPHTPLGQ